MFVNTCSEKWVVAERAGMELAYIHPQPPALRVFDAGMGGGTVLTGVMRRMHRRFRTLPFYIVGKEISLEDVRLGLEKMPDRFHEHPATVLVITNLYYTEAPWLMPRTMAAAAALNWIEVPLSGDSAHEFHEQIAGLQPRLGETWQVRASVRTGNPLYVRPSVLVIYREDHKFLLDRVIPRPGRGGADYDLIIASQPYRARMPVAFKANQILAPLARSLAPGGRLLGIHSCGGGPGMETNPRTAIDSRLSRTLLDGTFVITAEIVPPVSGAPDGLIALAEELRGAVDALNLTDGSRAEGIEICAELMQQLAQTPGVAGVHLMAPVGPGAIPRAVQRSGLRPAG